MQQSKCITINTKSLFEAFFEESKPVENLEITEKGLRLQRSVLWLSINSTNCKSMDFLDHYPFYINRKTKSILTSCKALVETPFTLLHGNSDLAKAIENPEGIVVYKDNKNYDDFFCVIGTFEVPQGERKEDFVALEKEDFKFLNDAGKGWALLIVENRPFERNESNRTCKGIYYSKTVDSGAPQTQWYRFMLEGEFPEGTTVEFSYYISDDRNAGETIDWKNCKDCKECCTEGFPGKSAIQGEKRRDALFRKEDKGRYLWFRITLFGTEKLSPIISSVMLFFPKISYLEYLPSVYREDLANSDFLDRFLAIFESLFFEFDFTIDHLSRWLDAAGTPPEFLEWLGSWVGVDQEREESLYRKKVPEAKQREYISQAVSMYRERGTKEGIKNLISIYTGKTPIITENILFDCTKGNTENENRKKDQDVINESKLPYGRETGKMKKPQQDVLFKRSKFSFFVIFKEELEESERELVRNIIEEEKPAYTTYKLIESWFYLDGNAYLGINTELPPSVPLVKCSVVGEILPLEQKTDLMSLKRV